MEYNIEKNNLNLIRKNSFTFDRKSIYYKTINHIRTKLLKIIDNEVNKFIKNKTMINSKTTSIYLKTKFTNITINLKTKQIISTQEIKTGSSSLNKLIKHFSNDSKINLNINPYLDICYNHYKKFKHKKKFLLAKNHLNNTKLDNGNSSLLSPNSVEYILSPYREKHLYKLTEKKKKKSYFNYLHSLCHNFHNKNQFKGKVESAKNIVNYNNFAFKNNDKKIKTNDSNEMMERKNSNNELKKSSSDNEIFTSNIIHLIRCKKIKAVI